MFSTDIKMDSNSSLCLYSIILIYLWYKNRLPEAILLTAIYLVVTSEGSEDNQGRSDLDITDTTPMISEKEKLLPLPQLPTPSLQPNGLSGTTKKVFEQTFMPIQKIYNINNTERNLDENQKKTKFRNKIMSAHKFNTGTRKQAHSGLV